MWKNSNLEQLSIAIHFKNMQACGSAADAQQSLLMRLVSIPQDYF